MRLFSAAASLFTDLYELTMLQAYLEEGFAGRAVFTLFVRRLPKQRNFMLACGLDSVLTYLETLRFTDEDLAYLRSQDRFTDRFLHSLLDFRFHGDVYAVAEGTPVFADEPILEIVAPLPQAQLVETYVMNQIHLQTVVASKAARVVGAARGRSVIDFGARRSHGIDAAVNAARACYIAGADATSNVLAGKQFGIPLAGTMAHSYVQAHDDEREAFRAFATMFPGTTLLVDTYDTVEGVRRVIELVTSAPRQVKVAAIRLDSGDLATLAKESRRLLDAAGLHDVRIFASSSLDEYVIDSLVNAGAPIDAFGVGTSMDVSSDAPTLDIVYKLAEYDGKPRTKLAQSKPVLPGQKQVFRHEENGRATRDVIARYGETLDGRPLLECVMRGGRRLSNPIDLNVARARAAAELAKLPERIRSLDPAEPSYPVSVSPALREYHELARGSVTE
jgi:nicotinate phosphoribosyltransferase